jgi:seryl-tRNA synthetase
MRLLSVFVMNACMQAQKECEEIATQMREQGEAHAATLASLDADVRKRTAERDDLYAKATALSRRIEEEQEAVGRAKGEMEAEMEGMVQRHEARARAWEERLNKQEAILEERTAAVQVQLCLRGEHIQKIPEVSMWVR